MPPKSQWKSVEEKFFGNSVQNFRYASFKLNIFKFSVFKGKFYFTFFIYLDKIEFEISLIILNWKIREFIRNSSCLNFVNRIWNFIDKFELKILNWKIREFVRNPSCLNFANYRSHRCDSKNSKSEERRNERKIWYKMVSSFVFEEIELRN